MRKFSLVLAFAVLVVVGTGFKGCYEAVTRSGMPKHIKTIAVPAFQFEARGARYRVESRFTEAVVLEIIKRGRGLKVQGTRDGADAVVEGTIKDFSFTGVLLDRDGRARVYEITIVSAVTVYDQIDNKVLYDNQNFTFRDSFEFSEDPRSFFNEEDPAVERMARAFAESVVSTITNGIGVNKKKGT
ncbi:MAG: LPS assembly lipoprotein LptE [Pyrinomonadaceae bacterium]